MSYKNVQRKRWRVGANCRNAPNWPGFNSAIHKGAELCRKEGGNLMTITCYQPRRPRYSIDTWDGLNNKRLNQDSVWIGMRYFASFENLPKFWIKYGRMY